MDDRAQIRCRHAALPISCLLLLTCTLARLGVAQCALQVQPGPGLPGVGGPVHAMIEWDPDGAGPLAPLVVVGGAFGVAGSVGAANIASYDPATGVWSAMGSGTSGAVHALAVLANGQLVVGGLFATAGGVAANGIAAWDGATWHALGTGTNGGVFALLTLPSGDTLAGGTFALAGGTPAEGVARWSGGAWTPVGGPAGLHVDGGVACLAALPNGDLVAGGWFTTTFGAVANRVARWNGTAWVPMSSGMNRCVLALHVRAGGELLAGGEFTLAGGGAANRMARWTGSNWAPLAGGLTWTGLPTTTYVDEIVSLPGGDVVVGGFFNLASGVPAVGLARWNGGGWSAYAQGPMGVQALTRLASGLLVAGGHPGSSIAMWDGAGWIAMGAGIGSTVLGAVGLPNGDAVVGGSFTSAGGQRVDGIARRSGGVWLPLGSGVNGQVQALAASANGDVLVGGAFTTAGGNAANRVARWDGATWSALGTGFTLPNVAEVHALLPLPNGDVIAGGYFTAAGTTPVQYIARWDGIAWSPLGSGMNNLVFALARLPNGDVVAGGDFTIAGGATANYIARWNGTAWSPLGSGMSWSVEALAVRPDGQIVAVGRFTTAGGVPAARAARWDGASWWPLGSGLDATVKDIAVLPGGDVVVAGDFTSAGGLAAQRLARYGPAGWSALATSLTGPIGATSLEAVELLASGTLLVGGTFHSLNGLPVANVATLTTPCAAATSSYGSGCAGAGGANLLTATTLPWLGSTFRARADGMPPIGVVASVYGFATATTPLAALLPQGLPGCVLQASPDIVEASLVNGGSFDTAIALPFDPSLVGASFFHFVAAFEFDTQGFSAITSSNGIAAVLGAL